MIVVMVSFAVIALRTALFPRTWAYLSLLVAVVLLIGPIGWAGLIFGTPIWALDTGVLLDRRAGAQAPAPRVPGTASSSVWHAASRRARH